MRAAVYARPVVLREVDKPVPKDGEVLIRIRAASINAPDWRIGYANPLLRRLILKMSKTKVIGPGTDMAGVVEAAGNAVKEFKPGDAVFGCAANAFAEYACAPESALMLKGDGVTFEDAACVAVSGLTALQGFRDKAKLRPGEKVLINGASGAVGTFAVQIAKAFGAHVTAVCSTRNVEMVRRLGADRVIDYTQDDFTRTAERYDVFFDNVGSRPLSACRRLLTPNGRFVMVGGPKGKLAVGLRLLGALLYSRFDRRLIMFIARLRKDDLAVLAEMMHRGTVKPAIDRTYALDRVAEALAYANEGHARAKIVIVP